MHGTRLTVGLLGVLAAAWLLIVPLPGKTNTVRLDDPGLLAPYGSDVELQVDFGPGITVGPEGSTNEFDRWRGNLGYRFGLPFNAWGLLEATEVRLESAYSSVSRETGDDVSGGEGIRGGLAFQYNRFFALTVDYMAGQEEDLPRFGDGERIRARVPVKYSTGPGYLLGEVGYTVRTTDEMEDELENTFTLGVGYVFNVTSDWSLGAEFALEQPIHEEGQDQRQVWVTSGHRLGYGFRAVPYGSVGLADGSPDWAAGLEVGWRYRPTVETPQDEPDQSLPVDEDARMLLPEEGNEEAALEASRGLRAYELGRLGQAQQHLEEARELNPEQPTHAFNLVTVLVERGDLTRAFAVLREARERHPDNPDLEFAWAYVHHLDGQTDRARTLVGDLLEAHPEHEAALELQDRLDEDNEEDDS